MRILFLYITVTIGVLHVAAVPNISDEQSSCVHNANCSEKGPNSFVYCQAGRCICHECFILNSITNRCYTMPPCTDYDNTTGQCIDRRKSQLTAFLLAFFLTWTGAANFYINRLEYAIPQLIFGILFCSMCCVIGCVRQTTKDTEENPIKWCVGCFVGTSTCLLYALFLAWWIAELVIFATNERHDGSGCSLINNL